MDQLNLSLERKYNTMIHNKFKLIGKHCLFTVFKTNNNDNEYYISKIQERDHIKREQILRQQYSNLEEKLSFRKVRNGNYLFDKIRTKLEEEENGIETNRNLIILKNITETEFLIRIQELYEEHDYTDSE
ncbi:hypothetical protein [Alphaentomopoxvirus acuprea]|uniref:Uncharacterized protein n=1 Tax=Alphaentomopoxvirus acuprea TaxID=62099 RepID=W6JII7_9POXV|nr:hypothetical protein BA82_gp008 [Anomala cuprea entomopoxvirus]YP_009001729.1 hypothetical protein BA82_gp256 [Anomala cuprea entomopoxvirus]BAO49368.1 hypothetical protein [Anomala cuprea entomopoxvirus]BAO49616.1 hypothetical protein [Anomala cuprea entomopoxvirus]